MRFQINPFTCMIAHLRLLEVLYTEDVILASDNHAVDIYISVKDFVASHN